ncbi:alpha/beta fold hydrolase [Tundrisphaera lichenicola]|uniref:alpha/beta fold hydrolase n=1 Tax=Tundrisphaera lichenicola TaxID=2029860 RepID=UPI003EB87C19
MLDSSWCRSPLPALALALALLAPGCASMRRHAPSPDLRPSDGGFAPTRDGWMLGIRHIRPAVPDPSKLPVVLCHGLGLNGTFWTITDDHLPGQLAARGYEVFVVDMRGSGASFRVGLPGKINGILRQTPIRDVGGRDWNVDDQAKYDVPAILDYVRQETGSDRVNWIGHSLGGMLMFPFLELSPEAHRIANFVDMGGVAIVVDTPDVQKMRRADKMLRVLSLGLSTGRLGRPMTYGRLPAMEGIDRFYFTAANVDKRTVSRFYGYTLEDPGAGALKQLDPYLHHGRMLSADRSIDYASGLGQITTPTLMVAGEGDIMADIPSSTLTFNALGSPDKTLMRFGRIDGQIDDYGHCDLVWSRHAPREVFPPLMDWLDRRQPGVVTTRQSIPSPQHATGQGG